MRQELRDEIFVLTEKIKMAPPNSSKYFDELIFLVEKEIDKMYEEGFVEGNLPYKGAK